MVIEKIFSIFSPTTASTQVSKGVATVESSMGSFLYQEVAREFSPNFQ